MPTATLACGSKVANHSSVTLSIATIGATNYYTTNRTIPTTSSDDQRSAREKRSVRAIAGAARANCDR
ncbi:hypothetical protein FPZ49_34945 [Paenibacillus cremeus]|uniref:GH29D-like beta-sandwich domain-containing protein n=2 Tax=Paenibacillus cremeus TaxID=2163881 RepID=A0A559JCG4_9BACL|nr:hypothetical protein FPZ49_34945 [Paenibacillus cremeus]